MVSERQTKDGTSIEARFPRAREVFLMAPFNNWSTTATPLREVGEGLWKVNVEMREEVKDVCFYVFEQGQRFGRVIRGEGAGAGS